MSRITRRTRRRRPPRQRPHFKLYKDTPKRIDINTVTYTGVMIEAVACQYDDGGDISNGFIFLDEVDDIFILRDAIDAFITRHRLKRPAR